MIAKDLKNLILYESFYIKKLQSIINFLKKNQQ